MAWTFLVRETRCRVKWMMSGQRVGLCLGRLRGGAKAGVEVSDLKH